MNRTTAFAALLLACAVTSENVPADGPDVGRLAEACDRTSNLGVAVCRCVAQKAAAELTPRGFDMLLATLEDDRQRAAELR